MSNRTDREKLVALQQELAEERAAARQLDLMHQAELDAIKQAHDREREQRIYQEQLEAQARELDAYKAQVRREPEAEYHATADTQQGQPAVQAGDPQPGRFFSSQHPRQEQQLTAEQVADMSLQDYLPWRTDHGMNSLGAENLSGRRPGHEHDRDGFRGHQHGDHGFPDWRDSTDNTMVFRSQLADNR